MPSADLIREADRQMTICNACRYCEGYCAVFPAMERRRTFTAGDLIYMANVCFDCRACYYACPYTPEHEYAVNIPEVLSQLRVETYEEFAPPRLLARLVRGSKTLLAFTVFALVTLIFAVTLAARGSATVFGTQGANFFAVVPYWAMVAPALALSGYAVVVLMIGAVRFWRETGGSAGQMLSASALIRATRDAFGLVYLRGGGDGCFYPGENASMVRRWYHHLTFYGFLLDLASTTIAAFYDHFLDWHAPYPLLSAPVVLGTIGGIMLMIGTLGLLALKWRADHNPADQSMVNLDLVFLGLLFATATTGLVLLIARDTAAMGVLLIVHLGVVAGLFLTMPYGKFAHVVYRYAALVKNQIEVASEAESAARGH